MRRDYHEEEKSFININSNDIDYFMLPWRTGKEGRNDW